MLIEFITGKFLDSIGWILDFMPAIPWNAPKEFVTMFSQMIVMVAYFLPLPVLAPLLAMSIAFDIFNIVWKLILRVKSFIPFMGD